MFEKSLGDTGISMGILGYKRVSHYLKKRVGGLKEEAETILRDNFQRLL